jgi:hypothetical protein
MLGLAEDNADLLEAAIEYLKGPNYRPANLTGILTG